MAKQLFKIGLRKCCICKNIKKLDEFSLTKRSNQGGHRYECKKCSIIKLKSKPFSNAKKFILEKLGKICNRCRFETDLEGFFDIDHIIPRRRKTLKIPSNVRLNEISNLQVLCPNCHRIKTIEDRIKYK